MARLNREKYIKILQTEGVSAAITALHLDAERWEHETFEGVNGFEPTLWSDLEEARDFSRELWNMSLAMPSDSASSC